MPKPDSGILPRATTSDTASEPGASHRSPAPPSPEPNKPSRKRPAHFKSSLKPPDSVVVPDRKPAPQQSLSPQQPTHPGSLQRREPPPHRVSLPHPRRSTEIVSPNQQHHRAGPSAPPPSRPNSVEGVVIRVKELSDEPPDPDIPAILLSLIFTALLILGFVMFLGYIGTFLLVALVVVIVIAIVFRQVWILTIFGMLAQSLFAFIPALLNLFGRNRNPQRLVPVNNYVIRAANGRDHTVRIKGQLRGASPMEGDRVQLWGASRNNIIHFRGGANMDSNEPYLLPINWNWLWLILLIIGLIVLYIYLSANYNLP